MPAKANAQAALTRGILTIILRESDPAALEKSLRGFLLGKLPESQLALQMRQWTSAAFRTAMSYDPAPELKKITCPVLALYAEKDFTVPASLNVPAMRAALAENQTAEVEELADLNLLFRLRTWGIIREANWAAALQPSRSAAIFYAPKTRAKMASTLRNWRSREKASAICSLVSTARISASASIAAWKSDSSSQARIA